MTNIEQFCKAREYLVQSIEPLIETFLTGIWDPCIKYTLVRDTTKLIDDDLCKAFDDVPKKYLPKVKFRLHNESEMTEVAIQNFFNNDSHIIYLGSAGLGGEMFDFYFRESFDSRFDYIFTAKYGHGHDDYYNGSKTAQAEYYTGAITPLAVAYGMALEDGII
jgi:hypothetical protein